MFEVKITDLAARIGKLKTKSGTLETPALLPVVHPVRQIIPPKDLMKMGFQAIMTNAYLTLMHHGASAEHRDIHRVIDFDGTIMTDSGGYQILEYGDVKTTPLEIAGFQERVGTDIAIILDQPTGLNVNREFAEATVRATSEAARITVENRQRKDILWAGTIQGGKFIDLIEESAKELSALDFNLYALGSPTEIMKSYDFISLAQMIVAAKRNVPLGKPFHLFGAGHPLTIPLAVALGCDLFDSASYILYAKNDRYLTRTGTSKLDRLTTLPCSCPICSNYTTNELRNRPLEDRISLIATHNLYVLLEEVKTTKQAIFEGRLWEYVTLKAQCHPKMWEVFSILKDLGEYLEDGTPLFKQRAAFFTNPYDQHRPEVVRHYQRLLEDVVSKPLKKTLLIIPETEQKPFYNSTLYQNIAASLGEELERIQICFLSPFLGLIPVELSDVYPLSQNLSPHEVILENHKLLEKQVIEFVRRNSYQRVIVIGSSTQRGQLLKSLKKFARKTILIQGQDEENMIVSQIMVAVKKV